MTQTIGLNDVVMVKINKIGLQHLEYNITTLSQQKTANWRFSFVTCS